MDFVHGSTSAHIRPMKPRDVDEAHRAATPLELLFDLVSVIAIAAAATGLHHSITEAHFVEGIIKFVMAFFAIWWAWMNYTWFASAYDNDDVPFRLLTMIIMGGSLTMAAGINHVFISTDLTLIGIGYVVMRIAMVALWLRAAANDAGRRKTALWYAGGIAVVQFYWIVIIFYQSFIKDSLYILFAVGVVFELLVPLLAEKKATTPWHRHHIIERYGLLNIIVLGEVLLAGSMALGQASGGHVDGTLVHIALTALVVVFSMWWLYFSRDGHLESKDLSSAFIWGYGHVVIYMAGAAVGAGFAVLVDVSTGHAEVGNIGGSYAVAIPVALYLLGLWFVRDQLVLVGTARWVLPVFAGLILITPLLFTVRAVAILTMLAVITRNYMVRRNDRYA
ncbi:MAG: hypothetical protein DHS20C01_00640 [marine bacterium B5-7]|nr:MAG: hypothetical protein DHS20C01_00640 [marine bacterium B5-7]